MATSTGLRVESIVFPPSAKPLGATNSLFLGGAGVRDYVMEGQLMNVTGYGVYLEDEATASLAAKWKGKSADELADSLAFYRDIITGAYEKFIQVTMIVTLTGKQYSEKARELSIAVMQSYGTYTNDDAATFDKFLEAFKEHIFPPGASVLYAFSPGGSITISFSKDGKIPETASVVLENKKVGEAIFEAVIGKNGISPEAKQSLASRLSDAMKQCSP